MTACETWLARDFLARAGRPVDIPPCDCPADECPTVKETAMSDLPTENWCTPPMGIANESPCLLAPMHAGLCEPPIPTHPNAEGADAEGADVETASGKPAAPNCDTACRCHHDDIDW